MSLVSRILVPVEFSPRCRGAAQYAEALASHFRCEIVLLHVVMPLAHVYGTPEALAYSSASDLTTDRVEQMRAQLESFPVELPEGLPITREVLEGDPARTIAGYANAGKFGLIVMPTHGYGPFRRFLLGSVTAKVLHDANCPIWTGPHLEQAPEHESIRFRKVLCAIDLGPDSLTVLGWAGGFAREFGAEMTIVHAIPISTARLDGVYFDPDWRMQVIRTARERIASFQKDVDAPGEVCIETGDTPAAIAAAATQSNADVLVIGRGRSAGVLGRLRTNAYAILRESPCPVVTV